MPNPPLDFRLAAVLNRLFGTALACSITLSSFFYGYAQPSESPELRPLREKVQLDEGPLPLITTHSLIDLPRDVNEAEYWIKISPNGNGSLAQQAMREWLPENRQQQITRVHGKHLQLSVRRVLPRNTIKEHPVEQAPEFLRPSIRIDSDHVSIQRKSHEITEGENYVYEQAKRIQQWVYQTIAPDRVKHKRWVAPASEILERGEGSASEKAVLMAALCRAKGIPARIVGGFQFNELGQTGAGAFEFHSWVEIYSDEWIPLDPSQSDFQMDAAHIKVADTPFNTANAFESLLETVKQKMTAIDVEVMRAQAQGSTEISLAGRKSVSQQQIPKIDITHVDVTKQTRQSTKRFSTVPDDNILNLEVPESRLTYGIEQLMKGDIELAKKTFQAVSQQLETPLQHVALGKKLSALGLFHLAAEEFQRAEQKSPELKEQLATWKATYFPQPLPSLKVENQFLQAQALSKQLVIPDPNFYPDISQAATLYQDVIQAHPSHFLAYLQAAQLYFSVGQLKDAKAIYNNALAYGHNRPEIMQGLGLIAMEHEDYNEAYTQFTRALRLVHSPKSSSLKTYVPFQYILGDNLKNWQTLAQGRKTITEAYSSHTEAIGWNQVGDAFYQQGRIQQALTAYQNALIQDPKNLAARLRMLKVYLAQQDRQQSFSLLNALDGIRFSNTHETALFYTLKGYARMRERHYDDAARWLRQSITLNARVPESYLYLADLYSREKLPLKALDILEQGVQQQIDPNAVVRLQLNWLEHMLNTDSEELPKSYEKQAHSILEQLFSRVPDHPTVHYQAGRLALKNKNTALAQSHLFQSYALSPDQFETLNQLAHLYQSYGYVEEALSYYQASLRVSPGNSEAAHAVAELIEKHDLRLKKPTSIKRLTPDEYDFLVSYLAIESRRTESLKTVYEKVDKTFQHVEEITVRGGRERRESIPLLEEALQIYKTSLEELAQLNPPEMFVKMKYATIEGVVLNRDMLVLLFKNMPVYNTPSQVKALKHEIAEFNERLEKLDQKQKGIFEDALFAVDDRQYASALMEAGFNPDNNIEQFSVHLNVMTQLFEKITEITVKQSSKKPSLMPRKKTPQKPPKVDPELQKIRQELKSKSAT